VVPNSTGYSTTYSTADSNPRVLQVRGDAGGGAQRPEGCSSISSSGVVTMCSTWNTSYATNQIRRAPIFQFWMFHVEHSLQRGFGMRSPPLSSVDVPRGTSTYTQITRPPGRNRLILFGEEISRKSQVGQVVTQRSGGKSTTLRRSTKPTRVRSQRNSRSHSLIPAGRRECTSRSAKSE